MSHKVTYKSEMKDSGLLISALKARDIKFNRDGNRIRITSGKTAGATVDLTTGEIVTDSDWRHSNTDFGDIRQAYSEEEFTHDALRKGVTIESRELVDGVVVLKCRAVATA